MNIFNQLIKQALEIHPEYKDLQIAVEKEILHQEILKILQKNDILDKLTFIGGTCLRSCYNAIRLSEDLDFSAEPTFSHDDFNIIRSALEKGLKEKFDLQTTVSEPKNTEGNVKTWKIKITTRPERKDMSSQKIHLDICSIQSCSRQLMVYINRYDINSGTSGLAIYCQPIKEIFTDKLIAFVNRPNRIKNRDIWDILWLYQKGLTPDYSLIPKKLDQRKIEFSDFIRQFKNRIKELDDKKSFNLYRHELERFLDMEQLKNLDQPGYWEAIKNLLQLLLSEIEGNHNR